MLSFSHAQVEELRVAARQRFVDQMASHLGRRDPAQAQALGEDGLRAAVAFGLERAAARGFRARGAARLWLELQQILGGWFDEDPRLPADARPWLDCPDPTRQIPVSQQLHAAIDKFLGETGGAGPARSLGRLAALDAACPADRAASPAGSDAELLRAFRAADPAAARVAGDAALAALARRAFDDAAAHDVTCGRGRALFAVLAFAFGVGFSRDPFRGWAGRILRDGARRPDDRVASLEAHARALRDAARAASGQS